MLYKFPTINHINDVLPYIQDCDEFYISDKGDYQVINYRMLGDETFPNIYDSTELRILDIENERAVARRECRGLVFDYNGYIINRRHHKFFNAGEREELSIERITEAGQKVNFRFVEKLDGSMVSPCSIKPKDGWQTSIRWMSKMGITDTSMAAEVFVAKNPKYQEFAESLLVYNFTPIFEWCSNKNRIVVDYPVDRLVLTDIRHNIDGYYYSWEQIVEAAEAYDIEIANTIGVDKDLAHNNFETIIEMIRDWEDAEGVVVRFEDGHKIKIKSDWYIKIHKVKAMLESERAAVEVIMIGALDDCLPILSENDRVRILAFQAQLVERLDEVAALIVDHVQSLKRKYPTKKDFALCEDAKTMSSKLKGYTFKLYDDVDITRERVYEMVKQGLLNSLSKNVSYDEFKHQILGELNYAQSQHTNSLEEQE